MAVIADCPGCVVGNHPEHVTQWGFRTESIIDGEFCHCPGDCRERSAANMAIWFPPLGTVLDSVPEMQSSPESASTNEHASDLADEREEFVYAHSWELTDALLGMGIEDADLHDGRALADFLFCAGWRKTTPTPDSFPKDRQ